MQLFSHNFKSRVCLKKQLVIETYKWLKQDHERLTIKCITMNKMNVDLQVHGKSTKNGRVAYL